LDADDQFIPESLEIALQWFEKYPDVDVFYPDVIHFGAEERIRENSEFDFPNLIRQQHYIQAQSPFRRSIFEKIGGYCEDDTLRLGMEDVDFWYGMLEIGACFRRLPVPIYKYRMHTGGSLSQKMQRHNYDIRYFIANRHRKLLQGRLRQEYLQMGAIRAYRTAVMNHDWKSALINGFHIYQHSLLPPKMWWRAAWNIADALFKK
jgi:GT2 family glycosyltransferase